MTIKISEKNRAKIAVALAAVYGKIDRAPISEHVFLAAKNAAYSPFSKRLMKGAKLFWEFAASLPKSYKYKTEVGNFTLCHNGREWRFESAGRSTLWAGRSTGKRQMHFPESSKKEVIQNLLDQKQIIFFDQKQMAFSPAQGVFVFKRRGGL